MPLEPSERAEILDAARSAATNQTAELFVAVQQAKAKRRRMALRAGLAGTAIILIGGFAWAKLGAKRTTPNPRTVATGQCHDGTWTYAVNRQGACATHGGVKVFYK